MTKKAFADAIGRTAGSLNDLLTSPSWPSLEKMASVLGVSVADLVTDKPFKENANDETVIRCSKCGNEIKVKFEQ